MKPEDQIAYIPNHAEGNLDHKDVQFGFVMSVTENGAFCRYFRSKDNAMLRTVANSELTPFENLVPYELHSKKFIHNLVKSINFELCFFHGKE